MATYVELHALRGSSQLDPLRQKIAVALTIKAHVLAQGTPTAPQAAFAKIALATPGQYADTLLHYILAQYNAAPTATIIGATDTQVQSAVDAAVDTLLGA